MVYHPYGFPWTVSAGSVDGSGIETCPEQAPLHQRETSNSPPAEEKYQISTKWLLSGETYCYHILTLNSCNRLLFFSIHVIYVIQTECKRYRRFYFQLQFHSATCNCFKCPQEVHFFLYHQCMVMSETKTSNINI